PIEPAIETYQEFIQRPRRHLNLFEAWIEFEEEQDLAAQEGGSTVTVTTTSERDSKGDESKDSEADKVVETIETPRSEEEVQKKDKESPQTKETGLERFIETLKELEASPQEEEQQKPKRMQQVVHY
ncbi:hypothetical protein A2U01_0050388, partial [Trifolium medium]|nr:hypothetical protein [Trifolium medium]